MNNAQPLLKRGFVDRVKEKMKKGKEVPESGILVGHSCVQDCEDRLLERRFIQCGRIVAVFLTVLKDEENQRKNTTSTPLSAAIRAAIFLSSFSVKIPHSRSFLSRITIP